MRVEAGGEGGGWGQGSRPGLGQTNAPGHVRGSQT